MRNLNYNDLLAGIKQSMPVEADLCKNTLGISADKIHETVIISPGWEPHKIPGIARIPFWRNFRI